MSRFEERRAVRRICSSGVKDGGKADWQLRVGPPSVSSPNVSFSLVESFPWGKLAAEPIGGGKPLARSGMTKWLLVLPTVSIGKTGGSRTLCDTRFRGWGEGWSFEGATVM